MSELTIFDWALRITAFPVWAYFAYVSAKLFIHICWACIAGASFTRWSFACGKINGYRKTPRPVWTYIPAEFIRQWWSFLLSSPGKTTATRPGGSLGGIGDWRAWKIEDPDQ